MNCDKYPYKQWKTIEVVIGKGLVEKAEETGTMMLNYTHIIHTHPHTHIRCQT